MKQKIMRTLAASLLSLACMTLWAQQTVKGTVKDASGEPMIGVTVATGKGTGAVTDFNGNFTLQNVSPSTTLNISYVGYKTVTLPFNRTKYAIKMEDATQITEVTVTAKRKAQGSGLAIPEREVSTAR